MPVTRRPPCAADAPRLPYHDARGRSPDAAHAPFQSQDHSAHIQPPALVWQSRRFMRRLYVAQDRNGGGFAAPTSTLCRIRAEERRPCGGPGGFLSDFDRGVSKIPQIPRPPLTRRARARTRARHGAECCARRARDLGLEPTRLVDGAAVDGDQAQAAPAVEADRGQVVVVVTSHRRRQPQARARRATASSRSVPTPWPAGNASRVTSSHAGPTCSKVARPTRSPARWAISAGSRDASRARPRLTTVAEPHEAHNRRRIHSRSASTASETVISAASATTTR